MDAINLLISTMLHIFLLFVFLSILFWVVITQAETKAYSKELDKEIDKIKIQGNAQIKHPSWYKLMLNNSNITQTKNNNLLFTLNITIIVLLFVILVSAIIFTYLSGGTVDFGEIILENFIILIFVGIIEFLFFKHIASRYIPVKPSYMSTFIAHKILAE